MDPAPPRRVAVVQARMGSSRLPGKTLLPLGGKPLLQHLVERLGRARRVDQIVVATTTRPEDDPIEDLCRRLEAGCFRGSSEDVLGRVHAALRAFRGTVHIEIHGDGPLVDWRVIDRAVELYTAGGFDLVTNALTVTYPPGLETWVYGAPLLAEANRAASGPALRESPAAYLLQRASRLRIHNFKAPPELTAPDTYLEVDERADYDALRRVVEALAPGDPFFTTEQILEWLKAHPDVAQSNRGVERRWKKTPAETPRGTPGEA